MDPRDLLILVLGIVGIVWYYVCLLRIGWKPPAAGAASGFEQFMTLSITTIAVSLATFVGMFLGLQNVG